jgi:diguanylate cyclase (GGDEF)-like protein
MHVNLASYRIIWLLPTGGEGSFLSGIGRVRHAVLLVVILMGIVPQASAKPSPSGIPGFDPSMMRMALESYLLYPSARQERAWLDLDESTPGVIRYEGGVLPLLPGDRPGMYTFRTVFLVDPALKGVPLALNAGIAEYPHRIYLNGIEILTRGRYKGGSYVSSIRAAIGVHLSPDLLNYGGEPNILVYEAYPAYENWGLDTLYIGTVERIATDVFLRNLFGIGLVQATFILSLLLCAYFIALYLVSNREYMIYLLYALICLSFCAAYFNVSVHHEGIPEMPLEKLSKTGMVILSTFMVAFCAEFSGAFPQRRSRGRNLVFALIFASGILGSLPILMQGSKQGMLTVFGLISMIIIAPHLLVNVAVLGYAFFARRNRLAVPLFVGFIGIGATAFHDMGYLSENILPYTWMTPYGYILFICLVFTLLVIEQARRHSDAVRRSEELKESQKSIARLNAALEKTVEDRTAELRRANDSLATLAGTDGLTGIANRRRFDEVLALEWRRAERSSTYLAIIMLDVDFFKLYNDEYGHLEGDRVLRRIAGVLAFFARRSGDLAARYGGEEFVLVLPGLDLPEAETVAHAVVAEVQALGIPHSGGIGQVLTISAGVAAVQPQAGLEVDRDLLVREADRALYQAKAAGRNGVRPAGPG